MVVPPHLAYGDSGAGDSIPGRSNHITEPFLMLKPFPPSMMLIQGGATLTFDVRLVRLNSAVWSDEVGVKRLRNEES